MIRRNLIRVTFGLYNCKWLAVSLMMPVLQQPAILLPTQQPSNPPVKQEKLLLPMRDGITLATDLYRVAEAQRESSGPSAQGIGGAQ